jgi:hypothetical protein
MKPARSLRTMEWMYYVVAVLSAESAWSLRLSDPTRALLFAGFVVLALGMAYWRRRQRIRSSQGPQS